MVKNMKKLIPADTVDAAGNVWETIGENIRNGVREISERDVKMIVSAMFPVNSIYCGENSFILSVGKWTQITSPSFDVIYLGSETITGQFISNAPEYTTTGANTNGMSIRMWKRVS